MKRPLIKTIATMTCMALLLFIQAAAPLEALADSFTAPTTYTTTPSPYSSGTLNYSNPNQFSGTNPYGISVSSLLNPQLLTSVIGCTGIVNKVADVSAAFIANLLYNKAKQAATEAAKKTAQTTAATTAATAKATAASAASGAIATAVTINGLGVGFPTLDAGSRASLLAMLAIQTANTTANTVASTTNKVAKATVDTINTTTATSNVQGVQSSVDAASFREECIDGIAIQLAKNELTALTRDTMNWITTGFGNSPYYPRDTDAFMASLTNYYVGQEVNFFETIPNADAGKYPWGKDYAIAQAHGLQSLQDYHNTLVSNMSNYLYQGYTIQNFSTNFSAGGWQGWLGMTQNSQNNPIGFTINASQSLAAQQSQAVNTTQNQLQQNGGIFDQRKCVAWSTTTGGITTTVTNPISTAGASCTKYETVSPGSVILSKINTYVNSPELQLTLVKTLNDALNALFASLIGKFENQGLSSLGTTSTDLTTDDSQSFGSNDLIDQNGNVIPEDTGGSGSGSDGSFDITKDLGDTYAQAVNDGSWDANADSPQLMPGVGLTDHYYTVSVSGSTDLTGNGDYWSTGDIAFFDGTSWSKGLPPFIISKRGVLQKQQDYVDATNQYMTVVANVMPALGQLDYCIPGPNPNWQTDATTAEQNLVGSQTTEEGINYWTSVESDLTSEYNDRINALYGTSSPMQSATLPDGSNNPAYLEMSQQGLALTSNIPQYADSATQAQTDTQGILAQTNSDIASLNAIKDKVNAIIVAAQDRRAVERKQNGLPAVSQSCLDDEKVTYIVNGVKK